MWEYIFKQIDQIAALDTELILLVALTAMAVIVWDNFDLLAKKKKKDTGLKSDAIPVSIDGSKSLPVRNYISEIQGLAGRPDAIIVENGKYIPVERKPFARKVRDRYVAQLLVYMRLIEEFEGKKPPYGYLILGSKCRRIKILNSPEKQAWLQKHLDEMISIMNGAPSKAAPHYRKCSKCDVNQFCSYKAGNKKPTKSISVESNNSDYSIIKKGNRT